MTIEEFADKYALGPTPLALLKANGVNTLDDLDELLDPHLSFRREAPGFDFNTGMEVVQAYMRYESDIEDGDL